MTSNAFSIDSLTTDNTLNLYGFISTQPVSDFLNYNVHNLYHISRCLGQLLILKLINRFLLIKVKNYSFRQNFFKDNKLSN